MCCLNESVTQVAWVQIFTGAVQWLMSRDSPCLCNDCPCKAAAEYGQHEMHWCHNSLYLYLGFRVCVGLNNIPGLNGALFEALHGALYGAVYGADHSAHI